LPAAPRPARCCGARSQANFVAEVCGCPKTPSARAHRVCSTPAHGREWLVSAWPGAADARADGQASGAAARLAWPLRPREAWCAGARPACQGCVATGFAGPAVPAKTGVSARRNGAASAAHGNLIVPRLLPASLAWRRRDCDCDTGAQACIRAHPRRPGCDRTSTDGASDVIVELSTGGACGAWAWRVAGGGPRVRRDTRARAGRRKTSLPARQYGGAAIVGGPTTHRPVRPHAQNMRPRTSFTCRVLTRVAAFVNAGRVRRGGAG